MLKKISVLTITGVLAGSITMTSFASAATADEDVQKQPGPIKENQIQMTNVPEDTIGTFAIQGPPNSGSSYTWSIKTTESYYDPTDTSYAYSVLLAVVALGSAYVTIPSSSTKILSWLGLGVTAFPNRTSYTVTKYVQKLNKPTATSAGYVQYKIYNKSTKKTHWSRTYNIGKNGI